MTGEKFNFSQVFSFRDKTSILFCAVLFSILDFIASIKTKEIAQRNLPLSVRDKFNFQIVSSSAVFCQPPVNGLYTSRISLESKTQFLKKFISSFFHRVC